MEIDFNKLELLAQNLVRTGQYKDALRIYFFMADGDPSLDAGYLAERIAVCYRGLGEDYAAKYWYGRAVEENPVLYENCKEEIKSLGDVSIGDLLV